ncbi:uncharacterized protein C21orf58 [Scomber scombrus]|uniref:Uncharacterized protein C21orf58 n=1 Tax=Scomber scombrus TaxID=13677 RepID=A0AAV1Q5E3_SCOSC
MTQLNSYFILLTIQHGSPLVDQLTRLDKLKLLEKEQHLLEDLNRPHTWGGSRKQYQSHFAAAPQLRLSLPYMGPIHIQQPAPALLTLPPPPPAPPQPPRIIQQALPQQPATIIQQLPHQQLLITQIPPLQPNPVSRSSSSIKEGI